MNVSRSDIFRNQIDSLVEVLNRKGYSVYFNTDDIDRVVFEDLEVFINSRLHPENKFYTLLHELGHIIVGESWPEFHADHPMYVHHPEARVDGRKERSYAYRVSLLSEEIEAWKRGRRFAKSLGFIIDDEKYDKYMTENIMTYIDWAAR